MAKYYNGSNYDFLGNYAVTLNPIKGTDSQTGNAPIEISYQQNGKTVYPYPRVRLNFFTQAEADDFAKRLTADIGDEFVGIEKSLQYNMAGDPDERDFYYVNFKNETRLPMNALLAMTTGLDLNGNALFDQKQYKLNVGNKGHFGWDDNGLSYTPERA
jgi:hypothetical protein